MTVLTAPPLPQTPALVVARRLGAPWKWGLAAIALAAFIVTAWGVGDSMSEYYGSIALSMSQSWSNFFFGSLDPASTVTLDKIPGSFWIPALFVRAFGFSPWAVVFPNALAATASVVIIGVTVRRWAGPTAGLVAAGVVATTPILVAVARSNQPETFFVLCLALTAWAATKALDRRSLGWLVTAGAFIAAGFHTYMLEAWAVWPALAIAYLCTRQSWLRRIAHVAMAGVTSLALSLVWVAIVALIPAFDRPYIGSTLSNSPWEMVFGYNGLGRFGGTTADDTAYRSFTPPYSGDPSPVRLLNEALATQIGWLLPTAVVAIVVLVILWFRMPLTVFAAVWFATFAAMFSLVAGMHQFYTAALAIPTALPIGTAFARARARRVLWAQLALPSTAAVTALGISLATPTATFSLPAALLQCVAAGLVIVLVLRERMRASRLPLTAAVATIALLLTPAVWSVVTIGTPNSTNPVAGGIATQGVRGPTGGGTGRGQGLPQAQGAPGALGSQGAQGGPGRGTDGQGGPAGRTSGTASGLGGFSVLGGSDASTVAWLAEHRHGTTYLAAAFGAQSAAGLIIASDGAAVLPIGGFNGRDPAPTLEAFQQLVADGELRYVVGGGTPGGMSARTDTSSTSGEIRAWVLENCTAVEDASGIYDCAG